MDDGKSTLIGRLLFDARQVFEDQLRSLIADSARYGTQGNAADLALLVDGLQAEREQNITIDVAYRFFTTPVRRFIVADVPGHEQYTRNMVTGASAADLAVVLVDASRGLFEQTYRHSRIMALLGVRHLVLAVNKMDLVRWDRAAFDSIVAAFRAFAVDLDFVTIHALPVSGLCGDNVVRASRHTPWYAGPPLLEYLETIDLRPADEAGAFRMAVQLVNRPTADFRGYCGRVAAGKVRVGDPVQVLPARTRTRVTAIVVGETVRQDAVAGRCVTLRFADEIDVSRGDLVVGDGEEVVVATRFAARLVCLSEAGIAPAREYLLRIHTAQAPACMTRIEHRLDVATGARLPADRLGLNEIGVAQLRTGVPVALDSYRRTRTLGAFILIDRVTNETVGAGMVDSVLGGSEGGPPVVDRVDRARREAMNSQAAMCVWLSGHDGPDGWTTATLLEQRLFGAGRHTFLLDADLHPNVTDLAALLVEAGLVVIVRDSAYSLSRVARTRIRGEGALFVEARQGTALPQGRSAALDVDGSEPISVPRNLSPSERAERIADGMIGRLQP